MLLDDNEATNFINKKFVKASGCTEKIYDFQSGKNALKYLTTNQNFLPELIFVDINMPIMSSWEFLEKLQQIIANGKPEPKVVLLSTSLSPADQNMASKFSCINEIKLKPLSVDAIEELVGKFFPTTVEND